MSLTDALYEYAKFYARTMVPKTRELHTLLMVKDPTRKDNEIGISEDTDGSLPGINLLNSVRHRLPEGMVCVLINESWARSSESEGEMPFKPFSLMTPEERKENNVVEVINIRVYIMPSETPIISAAAVIGEGRILGEFTIPKSLTYVGEQIH